MLTGFLIRSREPSHSKTASTNTAPGVLAKSFGSALHQTKMVVTDLRTTHPEVSGLMATCRSNNQETGAMSTSNHPMAASTRVAYGYHPSLTGCEREVVPGLDPQEPDLFFAQRLPSLMHKGLLSVGLAANVPARRNGGDLSLNESQQEHATSLAHPSSIEPRWRAR